MLTLIVAGLLSVGAEGSSDPRLGVLQAMEEELARNQAKLKLGENAPPYFISYQMKDTDSAVLAARYGALFEDDSYRERKIAADVRVGTYELDNSIGEIESPAAALKAAPR